MCPPCAPGVLPPRPRDPHWEPQSALGWVPKATPRGEGQGLLPDPALLAGHSGSPGEHPSAAVYVGVPPGSPRTPPLSCSCLRYVTRGCECMRRSDGAGAPPAPGPRNGRPRPGRSALSHKGPWSPGLSPRREAEGPAPALAGRDRQAPHLTHRHLDSGTSAPAPSAPGTALQGALQRQGHRTAGGTTPTPGRAAPAGQAGRVPVGAPPLPHPRGPSSEPPAPQGSSHVSSFADRAAGPAGPARGAGDPAALTAAHSPAPPARGGRSHPAGEAAGGPRDPLPRAVQPTACPGPGRAAPGGHPERWTQKNLRPVGSAGHRKQTLLDVWHENPHRCGPTTEDAAGTFQDQ